MYDIQTKLLNEYDNMRANEERDRAKRINEIYEKIPRIKEIDAEINTIGFESIGKIAKNPANAPQYKQNMKNLIISLENERNDILKNNGYQTDYTSVHYKCSKCGDTGYNGNKKCSCFINKLIKESYIASNIPNLENYKFENFILDYYSDKYIKEENTSPRSRMNGILDIAVNFCDNFDNETKGLLFYGASGLGKTHLSKCIAKQLIDNGKTVVYTTAIGLVNIFYDYQFGRESDSIQKDLLYTSDLLILDDLGTEMETKNTLPYLFDIIDTRISKGQKMIINTNHTLEVITRRYSERFSSRIFGNFRMLKFLGSDIRIIID